jgi:hypothetical protein
MNTTELIETTKRMGLIVEIKDGRVCIGGREGHRAGDLVKLFASLGLDVVKSFEGKTTVQWSVMDGGSFVASIYAAKEDMIGFASTVQS